MTLNRFKVSNEEFSGDIIDIHNRLGTKEFPDINGLSREEIKQLINEYILADIKTDTTDGQGYRKITIDDEEGLDYINYLFDITKSYYEKELLGKIPKKYLKQFRSADEVIDFLLNTTKGFPTSPFSCEIAKYSEGINSIINNPELLNLDKKANYLFKKLIVPSAQMIDYDESKINEYQEGIIVVSERVIKFRVRLRGKDINSLKSKILRGKNVDDGIGIEFEVENKDDAAFLIYYYYQTLFHSLDENGEIIRRIKSFEKSFEVDLITEEVKNGVTEEFLDYLESIILKKSANENYKNIKIEGTRRLPLDPDKRGSVEIDAPIELRTIIVGNKNEEGFSDHRILDSFKKIEIRSSSGSGITKNYIMKVVNDLLENNQDLDEKFKKEEIYDYFMSKLIKVPRRGRVEIFTTKNKSNTFYKETNK